jgi:phosphatidylglycerophosphate synthase
MSEGRLGVQRLLTGITVGRIALIPVIAVSFMASPAITSVSLLAFMFADLFDGILARSAGNDGPRRRAVDSTVDRIAIDTCLVAAAVAGAMPLLLVCAFLARDIYCAVLCARMMSERWVAIKADLLYRSLNCGIAGWALAAPFLSTGGRQAGAMVLLAVSLVVAADLTRSVRLVRQAPLAVCDRVIAAADLRHYRADWQAGRCDGSIEALGPYDERQFAARFTGSRPMVAGALIER